MKIDFSKILCTIGIIALLVILLYSTYIKNTYTVDNTIQDTNIKENQNNNMTNESDETNNNNQNLEQDNNTDVNATPEIKTLNCYSIYYDDETTKANIREEIIITFTDDSTSKQEHKINYSFEQVTDYNTLKAQFDSEPLQDNIQTNYDQTTNGIERIITFDYTNEQDPSDTMNFRNYKLEDAKTYLTGQQFICN
ncbi:MAG: hypothetical protein IJO32_07055 [Bacilli bacterium]|nr:hypothetical protein [Bacilli bacterium]